jgi:hypothetical protein
MTRGQSGKFVGDSFSYRAMHQRLYRVRGPANHCENNSAHRGPFQWSCVNAVLWKYHAGARPPSPVGLDVWHDYVAMCGTCGREQDGDLQLQMAVDAAMKFVLS